MMHIGIFNGCFPFGPEERATRIRRPDANTPEKARRVREAFRERGRRLGHLNAIVRNAGTFDPGSDWVALPKNMTEEGFEACRAAIDEPAQVAFDHIDASEAHSLRGVGEIELPRLGALDHDICLRRLSENHPDVPRAFWFLKDNLRRLGI